MNLEQNLSNPQNQAELDSKKKKGELKERRRRVDPHNM